MQSVIDAGEFLRSCKLRYLLPPDELTVEQWADERLILPREMSAEPGPIRLSRTPYLRQIFSDLADPEVEEIVLMFGRQLGKSTALLALMGYIIDHAPAPMMLCQPTIDLGRRFSRQRVSAIINANPNLARKVRDSRARDSGNTIFAKEFDGGMLIITGANSAAGLASMPCKVMLFDEVDDYPDDANGQGPPINIATGGQDTFAHRKRVKTSSPKRPKGESLIELGWQTGTANEYYLPCPHCDHYQTLVWPQMKWVDNDPKTTAYACVSCGTLIDEHHKQHMLEAGEWRELNPGALVRSYRLNSLYSPLGWLSWRSLVREFLEAKARADAGNVLPLRTFINIRLAETWIEEGERLVANELHERAESFPLRTVPEDGLLLVAFADVQDDRFELGVWALGEDDHMWTVDHRVIPANPGLESDWAKLDAALCERYSHALGGSLAIQATAIDTGGHHTHDVYRYVRACAAARKVAATKGMDRAGMPVLGRGSAVDVNWRGGVIKGGVKLWAVGVNSAKDLLFNRIRANRVHFSGELPAEWFEQMAAEQRVAKRTPQGLRHVWVKKSHGARNESLDIAVGAIWCGERLGVSRWTSKYWERLRAALKKSAEPAKIGPQSDDPTPERTPLPKPRGLVPKQAGFVTGWRRG